MHTMQNHLQDDVKVAVYTEQMSTPEQNIFQDVVGAVCFGFAILMAVWVNTAL